MATLQEAGKPSPEQIRYAQEIHTLAPADENAPGQTILRGRCGRGFPWFLLYRQLIYLNNLEQKDQSQTITLPSIDYLENPDVED